LAVLEDDCAGYVEGICFVVVPAKAGIEGDEVRCLPWTPAFAGVTTEHEGVAEFDLWRRASPYFTIASISAS
jgi:hypothetical protein